MARHWLKRRGIALLLIGALSLGLLPAGCSSVRTPRPSPTEDLGNDVSPAVDVAISSSVERPSPGQQVELTVRLVPREDISGAVLHTSLPDCLQLIKGNLAWAGDLRTEHAVEVEATLEIKCEPEELLVARLILGEGSEYRAYWSPSEGQVVPQPAPPNDQQGTPGSGYPAPYPGPDEQAPSGRSWSQSSGVSQARLRRSS